MTTPYEEAIQRIRRTMAAFPDVRKPMESIAEAMNRIERDRREAVIAHGEAVSVHAACTGALAAEQTARAAAEADHQAAEISLAAALNGLTALGDEVADLRAENTSLEAQLAAALAGQGSAGDPMAGVEHSHTHAAPTLRESLRAMAQAPNLTPGGISVLEVHAGDLGPLVVGYEAADGSWAPRLLRGRTLRVVGPGAARIIGEPAVAMYPAAGDCTDVSLEFWGPAIGGDIYLAGQNGVALTLHGGTRLKARGAYDSTVAVGGDV